MGETSNSVADVGGWLMQGMMRDGVMSQSYFVRMSDVGILQTPENELFPNISSRYSWKFEKNKETKTQKAQHIVVQLEHMTL